MMRLGERFYSPCKTYRYCCMKWWWSWNESCFASCHWEFKKKICQMPILIVRLKRNRRRQRWSTDDGDSHEGYGPNGVAILVEVLTDNKIERFQACVHCLQKMEEAWRIGIGSFSLPKRSYSSGNHWRRSRTCSNRFRAEDVQEQDDMLEVITEPTNLYAVKKSFEDAGFQSNPQSFPTFPNDQ